MRRIVGVMDEANIIQAVISGDIDAYEQLVERYQVGLIIFCDRILKDRAAAEDIAQEAFIAAFSQLDKFNSDKAQFSTWLYRIAQNKAIDYLRKHKRIIVSEDSDLWVDEMCPDFENQEQIGLVRQAVTELQPPTYRQVIESYYWRGQSYQEISEDMKIPINTVRTWLSRAKQQLRSGLS